ncbi:Uncharacterised protein [Mycobacteroides abscessus subsp. massiliense]|nr:Uncharacterised protein [Mycobacteroides abscessus subsp. massiliense]
MTRALAVAAWVFGLVAWGALVMFCVELFCCFAPHRSCCGVSGFTRTLPTNQKRQG